MSKKNEKEAKTIADFLESKGKCVELDLSFQDISWDDIELVSQLVETLKSSKNLKIVNLSNTNISSEVLRKLFVGLSVSKKITILDLSNNQIDDDGAESIANIVRNNSKRMKALSLHFNNLTDAGGEILTSSMSQIEQSKNKMIITLYKNKLTEKGVGKMQELLQDIFDLEINPQKGFSVMNSSSSVNKTLSLECSPKKLQDIDNKNSIAKSNTEFSITSAKQSETSSKIHETPKKDNPIMLDVLDSVTINENVVQNVVAPNSSSMLNPSIPALLEPLISEKVEDGTQDQVEPTGDYNFCCCC